MGDLTVDERVDAWLNDMADTYEIPDIDRQRYIGYLRGSAAAARARASFAWDDLAAAVRDEMNRPPLRRLYALLARRLTDRNHHA